MKKMHDLVHTALSGRTDHLQPYFESYIPSGTMYDELYQYIKKNKIASDQAAKDILYGAKSGTSYTMLKTRLMEKLYNIVLVLHPNSSENSHFIEQLLYCHKHYVVARILLNTGAVKAAVPLLKTVLKKSETIQQYDLVFFCAVRLRQQSIYQGNYKTFSHYTAVAGKARELVEAESDVTEIYETFIFQYVHSKARKQYLLQALKNAIARISTIYRSSPTYEIQSRQFRLFAIQSEITGNYESLMTLAVKEEKHLLSNQFLYTKSRHAHILQYLLKSQLHLQKISRGIASAKKSLELYGAGTPNWFSVQELLFILYINSSRIEEASTVFRNVQAQREKLMHHPVALENWAIFWGYLWLMIKYAGREELLKRDGIDIQTFRLSKILNEVPKFTRDKQGAYISILILQFHTLLIIGDHSAIIDRANALRIYLSRRLRTKEDRRSRIFVKLLLLIVKCDFKRSVIHKAAASLVEQLKKPIRQVRPDLQIEVIDYEKQWQLILQKCDP